MDIFCCVSCVIAAAVMVYCFTRPEYFDMGKCELLPAHTVIDRVRSVAARCTSVERGRGIAYRRVYFMFSRRLLAIRRNGSRDEPWEKLLSDNHDALKAIMRKTALTLKRTHLLGHVNGLPRVVRFCAELCACTGGDISLASLCDAINAFCEIAPPDRSEREALADILCFCLICVLNVAAADGLRRANAFRSGLGDGERLAADIARLGEPDYVCGLAACGDSAICRLIEDNRADADALRRERTGRLSALTADVAAILNTLGALQHADIRAELPTRVRYFGGEAGPVKMHLDGDGEAITADDRGNVIFNANATARLFAGIVTPFGDISLDMCGGAFTDGAAVYRTYNAGIEFAAVFTLVPGERLCICRTTVINRTACKLRVEQTLRAGDGKGGLVVSCGGKAFTGKYMDIGAFKRISDVFAIGVEGRFVYVDDVIFSHCLSATRVYCSCTGQRVPDVPPPDGMFDGCKPLPPYRYPDVALAAPRYIAETTDGGMTEYARVFDSCKNGLRHVLCDGNMRAEVYSDGDSVMSCGGVELYGRSRYGLPRALVALGEEGAVWTPYGERVTFAPWYCEFTCGKNGCITAFRRYFARGSAAEIFCVTVENRAEVARGISVMLSVAAPDGATVADSGAGLYAVNGHGGIAMYCSERDAESATCAEGFFRFGRVERAGGFYAGGSAPAPTYSAKLNILPGGKARVAFCIAAAADGNTGLSGIDIPTAERYFEEWRAIYSGLGYVRMRSGDPFFDGAHRLSALYSYSRLGDTDQITALNACFAAKYADANAVRRRIKELCSVQSYSGRMDGSGTTATLLLPLAVADIVRFTGDRSLLCEYLPFARIGELAPRRATVLEHCLRAIDHASMFVSAGNGAALLAKAIREFAVYRGEGACFRIVPGLYNAEQKERAAVISAALRDGKEFAIAARALLEDGECEKGRALMEKAAIELFGEAGNAAFTPRGDVLISQFYTAVTEGMLGLRVQDGTVHVSPSLGSGRDIAIELCIGGRRADIRVESGGTGSWLMRVGRVTYATDAVAFGGEPAVLKRNRT